MEATLAGASGHRTKARAVLAVVLTTVIQTLGADPHPLFRDSIEQYPEPIPVSQVQRQPELVPDPRVADLFSRPAAARMAVNDGVALRVTGMDLRDDYPGLPPEPGHRILVLDTEWRNLQPPESVNRSSAEGKADRTFGVGGLSAGTQSARPETILADVAYQVPKLSDHLFLLADGYAADLAGGVPAPDQSLGIARQGDRQEAQLAFSLPSDAQDLALQFFDYRQGHIRIDLSGHPQPARPRETGRVSGVLELAAQASEATATWRELRAPAGWVFQPVRLQGTSLVKSGKVASILELNPRSDAWLEIDGGYVFAPAPPIQANQHILRFTPEFFQQRTLVFLVPEMPGNARLALRLGNQVIRTDLSDSPPGPAPAALLVHEDGDVMRINLHGLSSGEGIVVADLGIETLVPGRGLEINLEKQFSLLMEGQRVPPDPDLTAGLAFGTGEVLIVPPDTPIRFELAFSTTAPATALALRGFRTETEWPLTSVPTTERPADRLAGTPMVGRLEKSAGTSQAALAETDSTSTRAPESPPREKPQTPRTARIPPPPPPPVLLPPAETEGLPRENEPNESFDEATLITEGLAASGFIKQGDRDFISFNLEGEPQLWAVEANGPGLKEVTYYENSGKYTVRRSISRNEDGPVTMTHLYLLPGRHTIGLVGAGDAESEYTLRVVPLGPPDPSREREPNDTADQANLVEIGATRYGWLHDRGDSDVYRFSLQAQDRLRISVTPPAQSRVSAQLGRQARFESPNPGETAIHEGVFGPGDYTLELKVRSNEYSAEPYSLSIERLNPFGDDDTAAIALDFPAIAPALSAFQPLAQRASIPLRVENHSSETRNVQIETRSSHWGWQPRLTEAEVQLAGGESREVGITVDVQSDAWSNHPVQLSAVARETTGEQATADTNLTATCEAPLVEPGVEFPIPAALRGGFNLAWSALGAVALGEDAWREAALYDGLTPNDQAWSIGVSAKDFPYELTVQLAGDGTAPVAGVLLNPQGSCEPEQMVKEFQLLLSGDGSHFEPVASGQLDTIPREQAWVLEQAVPASHARLRILSNHGENRGRLCLGEFKVIAEPAFNPWPGRELNVGLPAVGGHVAWSRPLIMEAHSRGLLSDEAERPAWKMDHLNNNEIVVGLHHQRAALLEALQWVPSEQTSHAELGWVQVSASMDSPLGPWTPLGRWELAGDSNPVRVFELEQPSWARFLRFSNSEPEKPEYRSLPETLRLIEAEHGASYHSILAEWGHYARNAQFELDFGTASPGEMHEQTVASTPEHPQAVAPGTRHPGRVSRGERIEWYQVDVPSEHNTLTFTLQGDVERLEISLQDADEKRIDLHRQSLASGDTSYTAPVEGGKRYRLRIAESERYMVIAWDNSGSVSPYKNLLYQALAEFANDVAPGIEYVNFIPFQNPPASLLTEQWLDQPLALQAVLNDYDRKDASSDTQANVFTAAMELGRRPGSRAMIVLTDAATTGYKDSARMWGSLLETRPRIFALELHSGNPKVIPEQQDLMQDLAATNGGHYSYFSSQADLDLGFRRASCLLRRPIDFLLAVETQQVAPPEPGSIEVELNAAQNTGAIEIIFDASGSMWARLDGVPRIQIAREVLVDLVHNTLPDDVTVALRVFGNREAQSCRTDLEIEPGPLDRSALVGFIEGIQPQDRSRTPLADSIRQVEKDLNKVDGTKLLILLTDGEESCDGDPDAAIEELKALGMDIRLNIVGLAIDDEGLKASFARWASAGGGMYFNAASREQLGAAMTEAMMPKFQVLDATDSVIAEGTAGSVATEVPVGRYRVRVLTSPPFVFEDVVVSEAMVTRLSRQPKE